MNELCDFAKPHPQQFRGSALARGLLRLAGWKLHFDGLPARQGVIAIYPHTSNWDTVVMIVAKWASGVQVQFWSKESLFSVPLLGRWLRYVGAVPVKRDAPGGRTLQAIKRLRQAKASGEHFWLTLTPEGTRRRTEGLRSGFYRIALEADVPLGLVRLDYGTRQVWVYDFMRLSGDAQADFARMAGVFEGVRGCRPEQAAPLRLLDRELREQDGK